MFEKLLLQLKGKAHEGPKERNTINEIYIIFQLLLLDSNKIKLSTCQLIFSIKIATSECSFNNSRKVHTSITGKALWNVIRFDIPCHGVPWLEAKEFLTIDFYCHLVVCHWLLHNTTAWCMTSLACLGYKHKCHVEWHVGEIVNRLLYTMHNFSKVN